MYILTATVEMLQFVCVYAFQGCMPNGCCRSDSGKLISDHQYPRDTYVTHDGRVASCSLLNSSTYCSSHRVCHFVSLVMARPTRVGGEALGFTVVRPAVRCPSIKTYFTWRDISVLSGRISMKLGTNIHRVRRHCWKGFCDQRSEVKVINVWML